MTNKIPQIGTKEFNELASAYFGGKPKQETTIEEAAKNYIYKPQNNDFGGYSSFIAGAKWQQERMYSEEEVRNYIEDWTKMEKGLNINFPFDEFDEWFEQNKKFKNK